MGKGETKLGLGTLARLRTLLDRSHDGILLVALPAGEILDANASVSRLTGLSRDAILSKPIADVVGRTGWERLMDLMDERSDPGIARKTVVEIEGELGLSLVELSLGFHGFEDGFYGVVVMRDVTERERAAQALRAAHRRLGDVIEFLPDATLVLDRFGQVVEWNRAMELATGVKKSEVYGLSDFACSKTIHGSRQSLLAHRVLGMTSPAGIPEYSSLEDHGDRLEAEVFAAALRGGKGAHIWASASALRDVDGNIIGAIETMRDRTEQREAAEALSANERDLRATLDSIGDALIATDAKGRVRRMNPAAEQLTGWHAAQASGQPLKGVLTLLETSTRQPVERPEYRVLHRRDDASSNGDLLLVARDGTERRVSSRSAPILADSGEILGVVMVIRDVTDQRWIERQLVLSQKMESIGRLASGIAHDFNNVLAAIRGYTDVITEGLGENETIGDDLREILAATDRARDLTRQLLAFGRHETSEAKVVDIHDLLSGLNRMVSRLIGEDIEQRFELEAQQVCVLADPSQIEQVLMNLVLNARDAMPAGGTLTISTSNVKVTEVESEEIDGSGHRLRIAVHDTGMGMDQETLSQIFEPFFTTKDPEQGTGIGLSTSYAIVDQLGGRIYVDGTVRVGTTFVIDLPCCARSMSSYPAPSTKSLTQSGRATILVAEDELVLRRLVSRILSRRGYTVLLATDGVEALEVAASFEGKIDLLVTDVVMPRMGGVALQRELLRVRPGIPTLFVSGYSADRMVQGGLMSDQPGFLAKPFTAARLIQKVGEAIDPSKRVSNKPL